jgi:hypothetical protein
MRSWMLTFLGRVGIVKVTYSRPASKPLMWTRCHWYFVDPFSLARNSSVAAIAMLRRLYQAGRGGNLVSLNDLPPKWAPHRVHRLHYFWYFKSTGFEIHRFYKYFHEI